jgi:gluconate 2-dehydrogenase gamma chain
MSNDNSSITRRTILRGATLVGAAAASGVATLVDAAEGQKAFANLTAAEGELLEAIVDRLIPSDAHGPGAKEARVTTYIDNALGDALASSRQAYAAGLAALDRYAQSSRGKPFLQLPPIDQDSVLIDCETGGATGFTGSSAQFFAMVLNHTRQGMFGDPHYGGNAHYVGWDLLGYPGLRTVVLPEHQKSLEIRTLEPTRTSAYALGFHQSEHLGRNDGD